LSWILLATPLIIVAFGTLGAMMKTPLSRMDPEVQLAEQLRQESLGITTLTTDASDAFRAARREERKLYEHVLQRRDSFASLGMLLGGWVGVVISFKLISLAIRRPHSDYRADTKNCVSCGRCFSYCPVKGETKTDGETGQTGVTAKPSSKSQSTPELVQIT
jgi:hypothetical protein